MAELSLLCLLNTHTTRTVAVLTPLTQEMASLKQQLELLLFATNGRTSSGGGSSNGPRQTSRHGIVNGSGSTEGATGPLLGAGEEAALAALVEGRQQPQPQQQQGQGQQQQRQQRQQEGLEGLVGGSHLATVAVAVGMCSPSRNKGGRKGQLQPAATLRDCNGFIVSDWGDFH